MVKILLQGSEGALECNYHANNSNRYVLIMHPHPLHGGTMDNKITYLTYKAFERCSFNVLRYNSRGVGNSQGIFTNGEKEVQDAHKLLEWLCLQDNNSCKQIWISGFSFGAFVAQNVVLTTQYNLTGVILIAPPSHIYNFKTIEKIAVKTLLLQGSADEIVNHNETDILVNSYCKASNFIYKKINRAGHFFKGFENELTSTMSEFIKSFM